jgi:hypothetical protein
MGTHDCGRKHTYSPNQRCQFKLIAAKDNLNATIYHLGQSLSNYDVASRDGRTQEKRHLDIGYDKMKKIKGDLADYELWLRAGKQGKIRALLQNLNTGEPKVKNYYDLFLNSNPKTNEDLSKLRDKRLPVKNTRESLKPYESVLRHLLNKEGCKSEDEYEVF